MKKLQGQASRGAAENRSGGRRRLPCIIALVPQALAILVCLAGAMLLAPRAAAAGGGENGGDTVKVAVSGVFPEIFDSETGQGKEPEAAEGAVLEGDLERIEGHAFRYLLLRDRQGRLHRLLWLHSFEGQSMLEAKPGKWAGKRVRIAYQNLQCYLPKEGVYVQVPQIRSLELIAD